jgi:cytochrome c oxidase assembly factor CtaG
MRPPSPSTFSFEPLFLVLALLAAAAYVRALRRGGRGGTRPAVFALGLLLVAASLNSPLETIATRSLLSAHLLQNAIIADWAPPLLVLGLSPAMRASVARALGRPFAVACALPVALTVWLAAWYLIHLPLVFDAALRHPLWLNAEHAVLIAAGLLFWWPAFADAPRRHTTPARLAYLLAGSLLAGPLGFVFLFVTRPLYGFYVHRPRLWGVSPLWDQHLGGIVMNAEQSVVFLAAIAYFFVRWLGEEAAADQPARLTSRTEL